MHLHCMTGCDTNSGFYGKGKMSVYGQVAKSLVARRQLARCGDTRALEEVMVEEDMSSMTTTRVARAMAKYREMEENEEQIIHPSPSRCRQPTPTLPPRQLLGVSSAPPVPEATPLATRTWLGAGG